MRFRRWLGRWFWRLVKIWVKKYDLGVIETIGVVEIGGERI